ncbi:flavin-containing monooxygenase 5-like isoform X1 [Octopus vulgaris]|uniref:Flavin-containing monooxygenase n=1 Tax=Octopus vulgaris TaxID=6645 RepID=A0AA36API5_OCTVU|nr:flavin-containing monooxygenase 5-like isoform X1 [Octopus vulgaris]
MQGKKCIAIIGAGASGLTAIKSCLDEGLEPVCFEKYDVTGGLWCYKEESELGRSTVMKSTVINTSKETMAYSDFPPPIHFPVYMHNSYVLKYLHMYSEKFNLDKYIQFFIEVTKVEKSDDFTASGQWKVYTRNCKSGKENVATFDGVLVCTGHHAAPKIPSFPGIEKFKGQVIHSQLYKHSKGYEDKRVVVIGFGNSGGDIAVEVSNTTAQTYLSTRHGAWVINRVADKGYPIDMFIQKRFLNTVMKLAPSVGNTLAEWKLNQRFDHALYSIKPKHSFQSQHPTVNDLLPNKIITHSVIIKPDVQEITENGIQFVDGTFEDNIDTIILATGYDIKIPFIAKSILDTEKNNFHLFKYIFPPDLEKPTLALIGFVQPIGALLPISELQCRLATRVFKGDVILPPAADMWKDIREKEIEVRKRYVKSERHTIQVDIIDYMDELAEMNGCKPNFKKMLFYDPSLALYCIFQSYTPYQYRLVGPGKWDGAKEALYGIWDRTLTAISQNFSLICATINKMSLRTLVIVLCSLYLAESTNYRRWCYFTNWSQYRDQPAKFKPPNIDTHLCTHISYAFATLKNGLVTNFEKDDISHAWQKGMFEEVNDIKNTNPQLKTYLAIGGWNLGSKPFSTAVINSQTRKRLIDSAINLARLYKFDGIEIDWEYPAGRGSPPEDKGRFTYLISELKQAITYEALRSSKTQLGLAVAVAAGRSKIDAGYEIGTISSYLDYINLMTYDFHGAWEHMTGHNSPLVRRGDETGEYLYWNLEDAAEYWLSKGAPASKMNIGVPTYGRTFTLSNPNNHGVGAPISGAGVAGTYTKTEGFIAYYEICHFLRNGGTTVWDNLQKAPYAYKGDHWISYENEKSLQLKVEWIKKRGFGGVMIWSLDLDDFAGMCGGQKYPLITSIVNALSTTPTPGGNFKDACKNKPNGNYPIPHQCKEYLQCLYGVGQINTCPPHQNYYPALHTCTPEVSYPCQPNPTSPTVIKTRGHDITNFCQFKSDGLYESPNACNEYIDCTFGKVNLMLCQQGLYFDPKSKYCFYKDQVRCQDGGTVIPHDFCANKPDGFYAHPAECHKYYICSNGATTKMTCLNGQIFENNHCQVSNKVC